MKTIEADRVILWRFIMGKVDYPDSHPTPSSKAAFKVLRHGEWLEAEVRRRQDTINKLRNEVKGLRRDLNKAYSCENPDECSASSGICGSDTYGWGNLSNNGYWEHPCGGCERKHDDS